MTGTTHWHCQTCGTTAASGHECSREAIIDALSEARRKAVHYHAQRVEADERIALLEDALRYAVRLLEDDPANKPRIDAFLPNAKELLQ